MTDVARDFEGRVALVTGAGSGIGRATALALARCGAAVACADVDGARADEAATAIEAAGGAGLALELDVTDEAAWERALDEVLRRRARLDIAVNCAGVSFASPLVETGLDDWRRVMAVNLDGVFLGTKHAVRAMRTGGGGSIVNVASASGLEAHAGAAAYCASKAAAIMFTRAAALECRRDGDAIRINSISPGGVKTPMWSTMPFFRELIEKEGSEEAAFASMLAPGARWAEPEEVAAAILYLVSDDARFVTGTNLVFDDGSAT